jgi:hypothetical protein
MNKCLSSVYVTTMCVLAFQMISAQADLPQARFVTLSVGPSQAIVLHLRPEYVSSVRVLEAVSSIVLGDPGTFKAEHSEAEPQLVFFKATSPKPAHTNALITTKGGHEIALTLVSQGKLDRTEPIDYILTYERPHSFLIPPAQNSFIIAETKNVELEDPSAGQSRAKPANAAQELLKAKRLQKPHWQGKELQVAVGQPMERMQQMIVPFAVRNPSTVSVEVLPPQIELAGTSRDKHRKSIKAEPVAIQDYWTTARQLAPGARADGIVLFERPGFKESRERLMLSLARADAIDRPILVPIAFVGSTIGGAQ